MADHQDNRAEEIKTLAREHAELAIATLAQVMEDHGAKDAARVMAAKITLERGFGAPERRVEQKIDVNVVDQRMAHLTALQTLARKKELAPPSDIGHKSADGVVDAVFTEIPKDHGTDD